MGAYGSPELPPNNSNNNYGYGSNYTYGYHYQKPKGETGGCLKNGLIAVGLLLVFFVVFGLASSMINGGSPRVNNSAVQAVASAPAYSQPVYIPPAPVPSSPVMVDDSRDFMQGWAKTAVIKYLYYPDTAKFSDNSAEWQIIRDGNICEVRSTVNARGKKTKQITACPFVVKIAYSDNLSAAVTYVSLGEQVCYDSTKSSKSK
jgi:hypothetical protein